MPFAPKEIETKDFTVAMRGYDRDEVHAFLKKIAEDYRTALKMGDYDAMGREVGKILETVNQSAANMKQRAEQEASTIVGEARKESQDLRKAAEQEIRSLRDQTSKQVEKLLAEAERAAGEIRERVKQDTGQMVDRANSRVEKIRSSEAELRQRLLKLEEMLKSVREELGPPETEKANSDRYLEGTAARR